MIKLKSPDGNFKTKLALAIKNGEDISSLIEGYNIKGLDLSRAIIKKFLRINEDISNTLFYEAKFGTEGEIVNMMGCNISGSNFNGAIFYGTVWFKKVNARNASFKNATFFNPHYEFADFRNATLCGALIRLNTTHFLGAKFDEKFIKEFAEIFNYNVSLTPKG